MRTVLQKIPFLLTCSISAVLAQSDAPFFTVNGNPVLQREIEINRISLDMDTDRFNPISVLRDHAQPNCPITTYESELERLGFDVRAVASFEASKLLRPPTEEIGNYAAPNRDALGTFIFYLLDKGVNKDETLTAIQRLDGLVRALNAVVKEADVSTEEVDFYRKNFSWGKMSDAEVLKKLSEFKVRTAIKQWFQDARDSMNADFPAESGWWNPVVTSVNGAEIPLEQLLHFMYSYNSYQMPGVAARLDPGESGHQQITDLFCLIESQRLSIDSSVSSVAQIKTPLIAAIFQDGQPANIQALKSWFLQQLIDEAVSKSYIQEMQLPFVESGTELVSRLSEHVTSSVAVTEAQVKAYFVSHRDDYVISKDGVLWGFGFTQKAQATDFRNKFMQHPESKPAVLAKMLRSTAENHRSFSHLDLPKLCKKCFESGYLSKVGSAFVSQIADESKGYVVYVITDLILPRPSSFVEARTKATQDALKVARQKYSKQWFETMRKKYDVTNDLPDVMKELEARAKNKPR
jgi:hypothetical protein